MSSTEIIIWGTFAIVGTMFILFDKFLMGVAKSILRRLVLGKV